MNISNQPWIKLLVAIIAAIFIGIIVDSWVWSIGTFLIAMFLFIWVADWIFGGPSGMPPQRIPLLMLELPVF